MNSEYVDYNEARGQFIYFVNTKEGQAVARDLGLDRSRTASAGGYFYVYFTNNLYAAVTLWDVMTSRARNVVTYMHDQILLSRALAPTNLTSLLCPSDQEYRDYQRAGIEYGLNRASVLIGDPPGVGKTVQAIGFANEGQMQRILVICPAGIRVQWVREILKWSIIRRPIIYPIMSSKDGVHPLAHWTIVSYELARTEIIYKLLLRQTYDMLVLDEAHFLKTPSAQRTRAVFGGGRKELTGLASRAEKIVGLTGTPLPNRPRECYTIMRGLAWDAIDFMSEEKFQHRFNPSLNIYGETIEKTGRLPELRARLRSSIMVRRDKRQVLTQLPDVQYEVIPVEQTREVSEALRAESLLGLDPDSIVSGTVSFRQLIDGAVSTIRRQMGVAMAPLVVSHVARLFDSGLEKCVLFFWHHEVAGILQKELASLGVVRVDGTTSAVQKSKSVDAFVADPRIRIFLGQLQSVGVGTDGLQKACSHTIFAEPSWVPGENEQGVDRVWRSGQNNGVVAQFLVAPGSLSEKILARAVQKGRATAKALDTIGVKR